MLLGPFFLHSVIIVNRSKCVTSAALLALPLALAACTTDFDRFATGGGGVGGSGTQTVTTTGVGGSAGGGGADPCAGVNCADTNPCTDDNCVDGLCPHPLATNPPLVQVPDDCQVVICVAGTPPTTMQMADDLDTPVSDGADCTLDECDAGVPYPPAPIDTPCNSAMGVCDDAGNCSDCNVPADCGADGDCGVRTCNGNSCGTNPTNAGTVISADGTAGNCQSNVCDGTSLNSAVGDDDTDLATDVATDCVNPTCNSGTPGTTNDNTETCDDAAAENGGQCSAGVCRDCTSNAGCDAGHECLVNNTCCTPMAMATVCAGIECGNVSNGCVGMIDCGACTTAANGDNCTANVCGCAADGDCQSAGANGDDCTLGVCDCDNDNDCSISDRGEDCYTAVNLCGCVEGDQANDCDTSAYGRDCLATNVCGCTVVNQATDCAGIGVTPVCDGATGKCIP